MNCQEVEVGVESREDSVVRRQVCIMNSRVLLAILDEISSSRSQKMRSVGQFANRLEEHKPIATGLQERVLLQTQPHGDQTSHALDAVRVSF